MLCLVHLGNMLGEKFNFGASPFLSALPLLSLSNIYILLPVKPLIIFSKAVGISFQDLAINVYRTICKFSLEIEIDSPNPQPLRTLAFLLS